MNQMPSPAAGAVSADGPRDFRAEFYDWAEIVVFTLAAVVFVFTFLVRPIVVSGPSMENTLFSGNRVIVSDLRYVPRQGDIVVLYAHGIDTTIIKRVAAVGGQTVNIDYAHNEVLVNGKAFSAPIKEPMRQIDSDGDGHGTLKLPLKVPEGCVFVLGDNRNISLDSRYSEVGIIQDRYLVGHVLLRLFPFTRYAGLH